MGLPFDKITWMLETMLGPQDRQQIYDDHLKQVDKSLAQCVGASRKKTAALLMTAAQNMDRQFAEVCARHSADQWLSLVRRIPPSVFGHAWTVHATLAILKYSAWEKDSTLGHAVSDKNFGMAMVYTLADLHDAWRIAVLSEMIASLLVWRRTCSKGGYIEKTERSFRLVTPPAVKAAIGAYERRRPKEWMFSDEAMPVASQGGGSQAILHLAALQKPQPLYVEREDFTLRLAYTPLLLAFHSLRTTLRFYDEPLLDLYGVGSDALLQVFCAVTRKIDDTFVQLDAATDRLTTNADRAVDDDRHRLEFTFGLLQRGYLRFPREHLEIAFSEVKVDGVEGDPRQLVHAFFEAFLLRPDKRDEIDVLSLEATPFAFETPGRFCYIDFSLLDDFLRGLLTRARVDWYGTAHGDRFNLLVKRLIEERLPSVKMMGARKPVTTKDGTTKVPDLLVQRGRVLYSVECKAFSKSRAFWQGEPSAVQQRARAIAEAVEQAKSAAEIVRTCLRDGTLVIDDVDEVQWVVCGSTQEYLAPPERYGLLDERRGIPRVCTHEEFLEVLEFTS